MEYQRLPCPYFYQAELMISASPVREWLDNEFDVFASKHFLQCFYRVHVPVY